MFSPLVLLVPVLVPVSILLVPVSLLVLLVPATSRAPACAPLALFLVVALGGTLGELRRRQKQAPRRRC